MNRIKTWFKEVADEMMYKVHWPSVPELQASTVTVLVASLLIALMIYIMDLGFGGVLRAFYSMVAA